MLTKPYRPWGHLPWVLDRLEHRSWNFWGCLSTEDRCLGTILCCHEPNIFKDIFFIEVIDPTESEYSSEAQCKRDKLRRKVKENLPDTQIVKMGLHDPAAQLKRQVDILLESSGENLIFDISSFPKKYFFPMLKFILKSPKIKNLLVTYAIPEHYHKGRLAENPMDWDYLPTYQSFNNSEQQVKHAIVGVGFLPFTLPELLKQDYDNAEVHLIFPFPPGPPNYQRTWDFVRQIEATCLLKDDRQIIRVDVLDVPGCYKHICNLTDEGKDRAIFAPYGPKPHSLAMCLFAIAHDSDVYYTQPSYYHPDYSTGMKYLDNSPETYAYCVKLNGVCLY